jgi:hypothetical protein
VFSRSWQSSARLSPTLPKWQKHDPASTQKIDHSAWNKWLKKYLVALEDRKPPKSYLEDLQSLPIPYTMGRSKRRTGLRL